MNKGLKVLSGVLALTIGLATAGMVSAVPMKLSKAAQEILRMKEPSVAGYKFYESITTKPEYDALLKKADKEYKGLLADSAEWARLSTMACEAAQGIESINNQLDAIPHLLSLASNMGETGGSYQVLYTHQVPMTDLTPATTKPSASNEGKAEPEDNTAKENKAEVGTPLVNPPTVPVHNPTLGTVAVKSGFLMMTPENEEFEALIEENKALVKAFNALENKLDVHKTGIAPISGMRFSKSLYDLFKDNQANIEALMEKVSTDAYKQAAEYVKNFDEKTANATKASLLAEKTNLNGLIAFVTKIANENGLKLMDKCALPLDADVSNADKAAAGEETQKDVVPNTGAYDFYFFKPLIPTKVVKVEKKAPAFTFEALNKLELLPRAQKTVVVVEVEAPAFTFEGLSKLELLPRR